MADVVDPAWNIGDNPNGGYLVALALRRVFLPGDPDLAPWSVTAHFLRPGIAGARYEVEAETVKDGKTATFVQARLVQEGSERVRVAGVLGTVTPGASAGRVIEAAPPAIPPPADCPPRSAGEQGVALPILDRLDIRIHPDQVRAGQAGDPVVSGWIRHRDGSPPDGVSLAVFADAFPPSVFGRFGAVGWVPTIELTVHVRRRPAPGWILGRFETRDLAGDRLIEDGTLWDESGAVVATSRQLGLLRT